MHDESHKTDDLGGKQVLVSRKFWYFGDESPQIPTDLVHLLHQGIGYSVHKNRRSTDLDTLKQWLNHWKPGIHGGPIDRQIHISATIERLAVNTGCRPSNSC